MDKERFTILLGGDVTVTDRLKLAVADSRVIAADGGMRHAGPLSLRPELWVGISIPPAKSRWAPGQMWSGSLTRPQRP